MGALIAFAFVVGPSVADAQLGGSDPSAERAKVRAKKAKVAADIDVLAAEDAQVDRALADLNANVAGQQARVREAQRAASEAQAAAAAAQAAVAAKKAEIEALKVEVRRFAVEAFVHPPGDDALAAMDTEDPSDAAARRALLELQSTNDADLLDRLRAAQEDLEVQQELADEANERAQAKQAEAADRLGELKAAQAQQARFADAVQEKLNHALYEAQNLEELDRKLSEEIRRSATARAGSVGGKSKGGSPVGQIDLGTASCPSGGRITVAANIAGDLQRLLNDAASDGVVLCGGGYRSYESQVQTRKNNGCPDVYNSPATACHPPTAIPGTSQHEYGRAVDFTCNGGGTVRRGTSCFEWLSAHAGSYGFHNLPSEPWHWSTNGK